MTEFDMDRWDELIANAGPSRAVRFDPSVPGGLRALTPEEDAALIDAIRLPDQRHGDDREHLARELVDAERVGDQDGRDTAAAHLEALDEEQARDQRADPRIPSRDELDATYDRLIYDGATEEEARAFEYLDARRDLADERTQAEQQMDRSWLDEIDTQQSALDRNYLGVVEPEQPQPATDDQERE